MRAADRSLESRAAPHAFDDGDEIGQERIRRLLEAAVAFVITMRPSGHVSSSSALA